LALLPALAEQGLDVRICVAATDGAEEFVDRLAAVGVSTTVVRAGPDLNPLLIGSLARQIRDFEPDLVHTHLIHADLHGQLAARLTRTRAISSIHSSHGFYEHEPYRSAARIAGHLASRTIAISGHVGELITRMRISQPGKVRVVPYGIDAGQWDSSEERRASARSTFGLEPSQVAVGVASRLIPHKGHEFLLRAYSEASKRAPQLRLLIAGDGPLRADLERQAAALGVDAGFLGFVGDVPGFLSAVDLLAFPTQAEFGEGFGLAALEAMAARRPVIATDVASLPEVVGTDASAGLLVDPANVTQFADALVALAEDEALRERMGEHAHERAVTHFSLERMVAATLAVYDELH
jgi:glycosyltransferase involved in cell wall biosynthesis